MTSLAAPAPALRATTAGRPVLPLLVARGGALILLVIFGSLHWMAMLEPTESGRAWAAVGLCLAVVAALQGAARAPGALRWVLAAGVAVAAVALALLAGGLADEYLRPDQWQALFSGIGRGFDALPGIRVPYQGVDVWTRAVTGAGGTTLAVAAALLAFWPRRAATGFPLAALILLVALYAVPAVVLNFDAEFLRGALLAMLVLAFLRLEKLRREDVPAAAAVAAATALVALVAAPALDGRQPWWDYEEWAVQTAGARAVAFSWDHNYGPLHWPRDGRELLRVRARLGSYWKARNLDVFDGRVWRQDQRQRQDAVYAQLPDGERSLARWTQSLRVTLRNLRSDTFVAAGVTTQIGGGEDNYPIGAGVFAAPDGLKSGDSYTAQVYAPRPSEREMRAAGTDYNDWLTSYRSILMPALTPGERDDQRVTFAQVAWPAFGTPGGPVAERLGAENTPADALINGTDLRSVWALARRLKAGTDTPFDYVARVEAYLGDGFGYSETPPAESDTLPGFLRAKIGFCQQFSGAEALLLRMGGVPARVATGFSPGSFDDDEREYVVRDLDAHSWVEVWFPGIGWVSRDPTPAAAPARSQAGDSSSQGDTPGGASTGVPSLGGDIASDPRTGRVADDGGTSWVTWAAIGAGVLALAAVALLLLRRTRERRAPGPLAEFERALRRARYVARPGVTLAGMERDFSGWPGAAGYVRALREQRYSGRPATPTREQRRGLRAALARDAGRLRAWWALPPRR
jgi:protein-glutamine gamma-glutamyltransferase